MKNQHTMLAEVSMCAERAKTDSGVGVLSNAASSVLTPHPATHIRTAVRCSTRHTNSNKLTKITNRCNRIVSAHCTVLWHLKHT